MGRRGGGRRGGGLLICGQFNKPIQSLNELTSSLSFSSTSIAKSIKSTAKGRSMSLFGSLFRIWSVVRRSLPASLWESDVGDVLSKGRKQS